MSAEYAVVKRLSEGLVVLQRTERGGAEQTLWSRGKLRKPKRCVVSGAEMPTGAMAYRPMDNSLYRYERIAAAVIDDAPDAPDASGGVR